MSNRGPHIVDVQLEGLPVRIALALESEGMSAVGDAAGLGLTTVTITFGDGSQYQYPNIPYPIAAAVKVDPEGNFGSIRYWPGYRRIA